MKTMKEPNKHSNNRMLGDLTLNQERVSSHLLWLLQAHGFKDRGCNVAKNAVLLLQAPALWCVGHDEGNLVGGV